MSAAEATAGVRHHVALSVVGTDRLQRSGYFRAKAVQEQLIEKFGIPYSIVHATQFFEFAKSMVAAATDGDKVHFTPVGFQPIASDDVAAAVGRVAVGAPVNGIAEIAGPEKFRMDEFFRTGLAKGPSLARSRTRSSRPVSSFLRAAPARRPPAGGRNRTRHPRPR